MKGLVRAFLTLLARLTVWKHRPRIVAVTGSVGKSSTKEAIALALAGRYRIRKSEGNLNNEFGVPLSILGLPAPKGAFGWAVTLVRAFFVAIFSFRSPEIYVLEYGIDHPGDMDVLLRVARPHVGVITTVETVHLENFPSFNDLVAEKGKLAAGVIPGGVAVFNYDNFYTKRMAEVARVHAVTFGLNAHADFAATSVQTGPDGLSAAIKTPRGEKLSFDTPLLGKHMLYAFLPAIAVAEIFGIAGEEAVRRLKSYKQLPGRLSSLPGIKGTTVIDSTYNAEPASVYAALEVLRDFPAKRRIAVLGDMLELGERERDAHIEIGRFVSTAVDLAILIGPRMEFAYNAIRNTRGGRMNAFHFMKRDDAIAFLVPKLKEGDIILVKGSQGMRLEAVSKALLADKAEAPALLVRQSKEWRAKPDLLGNPVG